MTQDDIEKAALASAANMGPAENAWVPEVGQIIKNYELTPAGLKYLRPIMASCVYCEMPIGMDFHCFNCFPTPEAQNVGPELGLLDRFVNWIRSL